MSTNLLRDQNRVTVAGGVSSTDGTAVLPITIDSSTGRVLVDSSGGGGGTVTSVSVVSANGFAGSVATATTIPAITISTSINAPVLAGNGTAISAATTTGSGSTIVLQGTPTLITPNIGIATAASVIYTNNAITASGNAATVPITSRLSTVTNNSAATLTITITTTSAIDGQLLIIRVLDFSAASQTITWVNTENSLVTVLTSTNGSTTLPATVGFQFNAGTAKWRCIATA